MPFVWSVGTIVGPCIGGTFADPHETWPDIFPRGSIFDRFPYLLPNLICSALLFISIILGYFLLEETLPDLSSQSSVVLVDEFVSEETPLRETIDAVKRPVVDLRDETYGTFRDQDLQAASESEQRERVAKFSIFRDKRIMAVVISLSIYVSGDSFRCLWGHALINRITDLPRNVLRSSPSHLFRRRPNPALQPVQHSRTSLLPGWSRPFHERSWHDYGC